VTHSLEVSQESPPGVALVVAVAAGRMLGAWAGTAGLEVDVWTVYGSAEADIADSPGASAFAWEGIAEEYPAAGIHLAAAVPVVAGAEACRAHIARLCMAAVASCSCGVGPWWRCFRASSHQESLCKCSMAACGVVKVKNRCSGSRDVGEQSRPRCHPR
jgi:hypothetical protein